MAKKKIKLLIVDDDDFMLTSMELAFRKGAVDIFFKPFKRIDDLVTATDEAARKLARVNAILQESLHGKDK